MEGEEVHSYTQAVDLLREIKRSNDRINSTIGVESNPLILSCLRAQTNPIEQALAKVDRFIARTERQYVGPDVLRRTATLKQHFRIQRDRRNMLISSIKEEENAQKERKECVEGVLGKGERKAEGRE